MTKLLFVDIESRSVKGELDIGSGPMGIAITHDSKAAFVGLLGQTYFAVVDIGNRTFGTVETGATFNEELAIDDSGEHAILSYGVAGDVKTFRVSDPAGTRGGTSGLAIDVGPLDPARHIHCPIAKLALVPGTFTINPAAALPSYFDGSGRGAVNRFGELSVCRSSGCTTIT